MQTTIETNAATGAAGEAPATQLSPEVQAARERIRQRLQAEVDAQGALPESRRAAALIGESSIRFTGDGDSDYVVVGPGGQPRHSLEDGSAPFSLRDLAAELRRNYPALFNPDAPPAAAAPSTEPIEAPPQPRDWLMLGPGEASRPGEPAASAEADNARIETDANAAAPSPPVVAPASRETETADRGDVRTPLAETVPDILPTIGVPAELRHLWRRHVRARRAACPDAVELVVGAEPRHRVRPASERRRDARTDRAAPSGGDTAKPPGAISGVPEIVDTSTLRIDGRVVRLFGVEWERGAQADDLTRYIAGREVVCTPAVRSDRHRCQIEGRDLSEVVLYNGGGRATSEATPELKTAEAKARDSRFRHLAEALMR